MVVKVGFLGYGQMSRAISAGMNKSAYALFSQQAASSVNHARLEESAKALGFSAVKSNEELLEQAEVIILGVKPHQIKPVLSGLKGHFKSQLIISIAAGITLSRLAELAPGEVRLVRAMPNTPALVGDGVTAICGPANIDSEDLKTARAIFESVGLCIEAPESQFDAIGAISGSGPAYFFKFMEALSEAGVRQGLPHDLAALLTMHTARGAARLALASRQPFSTLKAMVASPGGTTAEALYALEKGRLSATVSEAIAAAVEKSRQLGRL